MTNIPEIPNETPMSKRAEQARAVALQVRALVEGIEGFTFLSNAEIRRLTPSASVPDEFMEIGARAMESRPALALAAQARPITLRYAVVDTDALLGLSAELDRLSRGCKHTVKRFRAEAGTESLRVYAISQKVVRHRDMQDHATWVEQMKAALNRTRKKLDPEAAAKKAAKKLAAKQAAARTEIPDATPDFKAGKDL